MIRRAAFQRLLWRLVRWLHHLDFAVILPLAGRLPLAAGYRLAAVRGWINARTGRDWRSVALGFRHIRHQSGLAYQSLLPQASAAQITELQRQRFIAEAMDEYEARLLANHRIHELSCRFIPPEAATVGKGRSRGLLLLTPHFASFCLGMAFVAQKGDQAHAMSSGVTSTPGVDPAVQRHFSAKYRGLEHYFNGGKVTDLEKGVRPFYRILESHGTLMVLGDAPVLPNGVVVEVSFLGAMRQLAGGALRIAQQTDSDLGAFVCEQVGPGQYEVRMSAVGPAKSPEAVSRVYDFLSQSIMKRPGAWWASDLLPAMQEVPPTDKGQNRGSDPAARDQTDVCPLTSPLSTHADGPVCDAILITNSPLDGTAELALGVQQLHDALSPSVARWHNAGDKKPADLLATILQDSTPPSFLLVITQPELIATPDLAHQLLACLNETGAACAACADPRGQNDEWAATYVTLADFEAYVDRRKADMPISDILSQPAALAYLIHFGAVLRATKQSPGLDWRELPEALGAQTVLAPRAFVHSYRDYQQGSRTEMLAMLPAGITRVLDIGGGEGGFAHAIAQASGIEVWLAEPHAPAAVRAQQKGLRVINAKIEDLHPSSTGHFDLVCLLDVLEHLTDPKATLARIKALLTPGGYLLISTPNLGYWSVVRDLASGRFDYLPVGTLCNTHCHFFTAQSLEMQLRNAGFSPVLWNNKSTPIPESDYAFIKKAVETGMGWNACSLLTESLRVLAQLD